MSPTIDDIRNANFAALSQAADYWTTMSQRLAAAHDTFDHDVSSAAAEAWPAFAKDAICALEALNHTAADLADAARETATIAVHLHNAVAAFQQVQTKVVSLLQEADSQGFCVSQPGGSVQVSPGVLPAPGTPLTPDQAAAMQQKVSQASALEQDLLKALQDAIDADQRAFGFLRNATGGEDQEFAQDPNADPTKDVQNAADLLNKSDLSNADAQQLQAILERNQGNDLFATQLMESVPPEKVEQLALTYGPDDQTTKDVAATLATASPYLLSNQQWMADMRNAGGKDMFSESTFDRRKGYLGLSYLLKDGGSFDRTFLDSVGDDIVSFERHSPQGPKVWNDDWGAHDPVDNLMVALKNNPDAAQGFFHQDTGNASADTAANRDRIDYLLNQRKWLIGIPAPAQKSAGEALEAATTDGPRTHEQLQILSDMVAVLGKERHTELPESLQESVTKMLTANIASVHVGLNDHLATGPDLPPGVTDVARFDDGTLRNVLEGLGGQKDASSLQKLHAAETVFMVQELNKIIPPGTGGGRRAPMPRLPPRTSSTSRHTQSDISTP